MKNQHSMLESVIYHLLPGIIMMLVFSLLSFLIEGQNLPVPLVLLVSWVIAGIPVELGILFYQGYKFNQRISLEGVVLFRESIENRQLAKLVFFLLVWALIFLTILTPFANNLMSIGFSWWPQQLILSDFPQKLDQYSNSVLWLVLGLSAVLNIAVPVVEEFYFRGFLLPRMPIQGKWTPIISTTLFSLYHFWMPWEFINRIFALAPMTYKVWQKKNIYIGIWVHILLNSFGTIGLLALLLS